MPRKRISGSIGSRNPALEAITLPHVVTALPARLVDERHGGPHLGSKALRRGVLRALRHLLLRARAVMERRGKAHAAHVVGEVAKDLLRAVRLEDGGTRRAHRPTLAEGLLAFIEALLPFAA